MAEAVMFTHYEPVLVQRAAEQRIPTLSEAIALKTASTQNKQPNPTFDVDGVHVAADWWQVDLMAKVQTGATDFSRALTAVGLQPTWDTK